MTHGCNEWPHCDTHCEWCDTHPYCWTTCTAPGGWPTWSCCDRTHQSQACRDGSAYSNQVPQCGYNPQGHEWIGFHGNTVDLRGDGCLYQDYHSNMVIAPDYSAPTPCTSSVGGEAGEGGYCNEDSDCPCTDGFRCCFCMSDKGFEVHDNASAFNTLVAGSYEAADGHIGNEYSGRCTSIPYGFKHGMVTTQTGKVWASARGLAEKCDCDWTQHSWECGDGCNDGQLGSIYGSSCGGDGFWRLRERTTTFTDTIDTPDAHSRGACCLYDDGYDGYDYDSYTWHNRNHSIMMLGASNDTITCVGYLTAEECVQIPWMDDGYSDCVGVWCNTTTNIRGMYQGVWLGAGTHCGQCNGVCSGPNGQFDSSGLSESDCTAKWSGTGVQLEMECPGDSYWKYDLCYSDPCDGAEPPDFCNDTKRTTWGACGLKFDNEYPHAQDYQHYNCMYTTESRCEEEALFYGVEFEFDSDKTCKEMNYYSGRGACCQFGSGDFDGSPSFGGISERWNPYAGHPWYNGFRDSNRHGVRTSTGFYLGGRPEYDDYPVWMGNYKGFVDRPCTRYYFTSQRRGFYQGEQIWWQNIPNYAIGGVYWGDGVNVESVDCSLSIGDGACCQTDGGCSNGTLEECGTAGGLFLGDWTYCHNIECPTNCAVCHSPKGACCKNGTCRLLTEADCSGINGDWFGLESCEGIECACYADNHCPDGCCCDGQCSTLCPCGSYFFCDGSPCPIDYYCCEGNCQSTECVNNGGADCGDTCPASSYCCDGNCQTGPCQDTTFDCGGSPCPNGNCCCDDITCQSCPCPDNGGGDCGETCPASSYCCDGNCQTGPCCRSNADCSEGLKCCDDGTCRDDCVDGPGQEACERDGDCYPGYCCDGECSESPCMAPIISSHETSYRYVIVGGDCVWILCPDNNCPYQPCNG